jgi:PAS domain S-box-containing protein
MLHHKVAARDGCGQIVKWYGSSVDIEDRKRAEEQLRLSTQELRRHEAYLAEAQRLSHTGSFGWSPDDGEVVWSDETHRIFEYDNTVKPAVDSAVQRVHPQDRAIVQQVIDRASQTGADFEHEYRLLLPDGRIKYVHAIAHAVQNASGDREFIGAVTDITERKTTEDKLRRLVDAGILGIFIANLDGEIVEANQTFLQMLQYDRQDLVLGRLRWADLTPVELHELDQRALREAQANGCFQPYEKQYFRKDSSRLPVLTGGALFQSETEGVVFALDLSEQKRAEAEIKRAEEALRAALSEQARLSAVRADIGMALARKDSLGEILCACTEAMVQHLDAAFARIWMLNSDSGELELQASAGMYTRLNGRYSRIPIGQIKIGLIAQDRKPQLTNDVQNDPRIDDKDWARAENITAFAGYPLVIEDRTVGVMGMFFQIRLKQSTLDTLSFLADGIAQGIERKHAEDKLRWSEAYLTDAQRLSHTGSWAWSPDHDIRYWSEECYLVLSFDPQRCYGNPLQNLYKSFTRPSHDALLCGLDWKLCCLG